jgi:sugar O-acyltransferase (sialic acid O-acetyltransferase NeuD family)
MAKKVIIIGGSGNGSVVASCIQDMRRRFNIIDYEVYGYLNDFLKEGELIDGFPILGKLSDVNKYLSGNFYFLYAIHSITLGTLRMRRFKELNIPDKKLITLVHPQTFIGEKVELAPGVFIMANSYIGPSTKIGRCTFVMANCAIGHNNIIGSFCHFSVGATISSVLEIGDGADICLNATVLEKVKIGKCAVVGSAAMCTKSVADYEVVIGNPARHLKYVNKEDSYVYTQ